MIGLTHSELLALSPCADRAKAVTRLLGGAKTWDGNKIDAAKAKSAGVTFDDLVWAASALSGRDKDIERRVRLWMADCAARVLHIYEKQAPTDVRVRQAIIVSRQFARGEATDAAWAAAGAAARDAVWDAAWAAARAAAWDAAGAAAGAAARAAAWDAAWAAAGAAARAAAWDAARAAAWAAAGAAEEAWQFDHLVLWLSDDEPQDWPLPEVQS